MHRRGFLCSAALAVTPLASRAAAPGALESGLRFRALAAQSLRNAVASTRLSQDAAASLRLPGVAIDLVDSVYRYFFTANIVLPACERSATPLLGFYSALVDGWWLVVTGPDRKFNDARLAAAPLFTGARADPGTLAELADYGAVATLRNRAARAVADFRAEFAQEATTAPHAYQRITSGEETRVAVRDRIVALAASVEAFGTDRAAMDIYAGLTAALAMSLPVAPDSIGSAVAGAFVTLAEQPQPLRAGLAPLLAMRHASGWTIASGSPTSGSRLLMCRIDPSLAKPVTRLAIIDLKPG